MSSSSFVDSFQARKREIFMFSLNRLLEIFSSKVVLGLFRLVQVFDYAIRKKEIKPSITFKQSRNLSRMSPSPLLGSFKARKADVFMFNLNPLFEVFSNKVFLGLFRKVQIFDYAHPEKKKPLITSKQSRNSSRMSTTSILDSLEVRKQEIFMFDPNKFLVTV